MGIHFRGDDRTDPASKHRHTLTASEEEVVLCGLSRCERRDQQRGDDEREFPDHLLLHQLNS
jgi:hypothetical protein